ncbi:MAG: hypothetical protein ACSLE9_20490 [Burkholderiaceae bacterium]
MEVVVFCCLLKVPLLLKTPPLMLLSKVLASLNVSVLLTALVLAMEMVLLLPVLPPHVVLPPRLTMRPPAICLVSVPVMLTAPLAKVAPVPVTMPPVQFHVPAMLMFPVPPIAPPDKFSPPVDEAAVALNEPPVTLNVPVPVNDWIVTEPLRNVVSNAPSRTSSVAPGSPVLQLAAKSQNEAFGPTQVMVAPRAGRIATAQASATAVMEKTADRFFMIRSLRHIPTRVIALGTPAVVTQTPRATKI